MSTSDIILGFVLAFAGLFNILLGVKFLFSQSVRTAPGIVFRGLSLKLLSLSIIIAGVGLLVYGIGSILGHSFEYICSSVMVVYLVGVFLSAMIQRLQKDKPKR